jgi:DUF4097 and DUF4098 domain-containing protein YvlB
MAVVHLRATLPAGSRAEARTYNGDIQCGSAPTVWLSTYNGDITAIGLEGDSRVKTYNGDVTVSAANGCRPIVDAETYNGDIRVLDDNVRLRPSTYNGRVRYSR